MADYARKGSSDRLARSHAEQIRRIRTRIPISGEAITYQITDADLNNSGGAGWFVDGYPYPSFTRQGDLVVLNGAFSLQKPYVPSDETIINVGAIPAEFRPHQFVRTFSGGFGFNDDRLWMIYIWSNGRMTLADMHFNGSAHPNPAWGDTDDGLDHTLNIETVYPAASLGLGDPP